MHDFDAVRRLPQIKSQGVRTLCCTRYPYDFAKPLILGTNDLKVKAGVVKRRKLWQMRRKIKLRLGENHMPFIDDQIRAISRRIELQLKGGRLQALDAEETDNPAKIRSRCSQLEVRLFEALQI